MQNTIKAVFFDRDGTLIHEKPGTYLSDPAAVRLYAPVKPALQKLARAGFQFFIVSNQSGIGRGYFTEKEVNKVHARLQALFAGPVGTCPSARHCILSACTRRKMCLSQARHTHG